MIRIIGIALGVDRLLIDFCIDRLSVIVLMFVARCPWAFVGVKDFQYQDMSSECPWMLFDMVALRCQTQGHGDVKINGLVQSVDGNRVSIEG